MRALAAALTLVALGAAAWLILSALAPELPPAPGGLPVAQKEPAPAGGGALWQGDASKTSARAVSPTAPRLADGLADAPTCWMRVVDHETSLPIEGAAIYRLRQGDGEPALCYTDAGGIAPLPLASAGQLVVVQPGYLLRNAPVRLGSSAEDPQSVRLVADRWSTRGRFRFVQPDGSEPELVCALFAPAREGDGDQPLPDSLRRVDDVILRAWREQRTLAAVRVFPELHVQLGRHNADLVHLLRGDDEVAFVEAGPFVLRAATTDGLAAQVRFDTSDFGAGPLTVQLAPGLALRGMVRSGDGRPVAAARVSLDGGDPLRLLSFTGADGRFDLGPLAPGPVRLLVRHLDHETPPLIAAQAGEADVEVRLVALPASSIRGRVVAKGNGQPVAGARASLDRGDGAPVVFESDDDGCFAGALPAGDAVRLNVGADGFVTHSELVTPGSAALQIELWPSSQSDRLALGLSAVVSGVLVDQNNAPMPRAGVRWLPDAPPMADLGRRVLAGGALSIPQAATTGPDGSFQIEATSFGSGTLAPTGAAATDGLRVEVAPGASVSNLRVTIRRP